VYGEAAEVVRKCLPYDEQIESEFRNRKPVKYYCTTNDQNEDDIYEEAVPVHSSSSGASVTEEQPLDYKLMLLKRGRQTSAMSDERYRQFFAEADADNSGYLTLEELTTALRRRGYTDSDSKIKAMFRAVDDSGDNKISFQEYMVAMGQMPATDHKAASMRSCFRSFDKNGDGKIDRSELSAVFRELERSMSADELERIMRYADKDGSGTLDYNEFVDSVFGVRK
jgi:Ca2+-binding EF-hand superfamily protein